MFLEKAEKNQSSSQQSKIPVVGKGVRETALWLSTTWNSVPSNVGKCGTVAYLERQ